MKITYLILAHDEPAHLERMIEALDHPNAEFIIHIDKKSNTRSFFTGKLQGFKNVFFLKKRLPVSWGGFSMVEATLNLVRAALRQNKKGYLILLSGHDFPVKPADYIYNFLVSNYGTEFLESFALPYSTWDMNGGLGRIAYYWFIDKVGLDDSRRLYYIQKKAGLIRPYFQDFTPYGGAQWWTLTCECADYIVKYIRFNTVYKEFYELTYIPDEMFFHSIILNSPFKKNVLNNNLRYIDWNTGPEYPRVLTNDDLEKIIGSERLWARKFSSAKDYGILDQIEKTII